MKFTRVSWRYILAGGGGRDIDNLFDSPVSGTTQQCGEAEPRATLSQRGAVDSRNACQAPPSDAAETLAPRLGATGEPPGSFSFASVFPAPFPRVARPNDGQSALVPRLRCALHPGLRRATWHATMAPKCAQTVVTHFKANAGGGCAAMPYQTRTQGSPKALVSPAEHG